MDVRSGRASRGSADKTPRLGEPTHAWVDRNTHERLIKDVNRRHNLSESEKCSRRKKRWGRIRGDWEFTGGHLQCYESGETSLQMRHLNSLRQNNGAGRGKRVIKEFPLKMIK